MTWWDRDYTYQPAGDGGWLLEGQTITDPNAWRVYGFVLSADGTGCAYVGFNGTAASCKQSEGPDVLRLGGGTCDMNLSDPTVEFGVGAIAELATWDRALSVEETAQAAAYFQARYAPAIGASAGPAEAGELPDLMGGG